MLNAKRAKHWKLSLGVALVMLVGLVLTACVPQDLTTNVAQTRTDVAALAKDIGAMKAKIDEMEKGSQEPRAIERETKDQVIRGRADLLDYRMNYDAFRKALEGKMNLLFGTPAKKQQGKPDVPAKAGLVETQLSKLQSTLAGTPSKKDAKTGKVTPAKPGVLANRADVDNLTKALSDIKAQLDRIEKSLAAPVAPPAPAAPKP